jgi:hypothetical protein
MFEPRLNQNLKAYLDLHRPDPATKKHQILIYGRPSVSRNAFELIIEALKKWVWVQEDISKWQILSAGELHPAVDLGNGKVVRSVGKMSLEEYAGVLSDSMIGISLMISPHPSYPPLEMAAFGMGVITNTYANKDLSSWHENIVSLRSNSPEVISQQLCEMCSSLSVNPQRFTEGKLLNGQYLSTDNQFKFISEIKDIYMNTGCVVEEQI